MRRKKGKCKLKSPVFEVYVAQPAGTHSGIRIQEPLDDLVTVDIPTAQLIFKGKGETIAISDSEGEGNPLADHEEVVICLAKKKKKESSIFFHFLKTKCRSQQSLRPWLKEIMVPKLLAPLVARLALLVKDKGLPLKLKFPLLLI